jgi:hypothetical protein
MFVLDPAAAVREAHRVLVSGGPAAFAVWVLASTTRGSASCSM